MQQINIQISKNDIKYAESILLEKGQSFDPERRNFIQNLDTIDLQAVPGSGKTTALLAKLLILEKKMPFKDGSGILVLSHTNTAVDEIKDKLGEIAPKLFEFPNFIGTIQSFVDEFLAKPYYIGKFKKKPESIDTEIYNDQVDNQIRYSISGFSRQEKANAIYFLNGMSKLYSVCFGTKEGSLILIDSGNEEELIIKRPRSDSWSIQEKNRVYEYILKFKKKLLANGYMSYEDAYFLGERYIKNFPKIKKLLQKRFGHVFVDEMQDMGNHQINILEELFYKKYILNHSFQRIGDINQAIYGGSVKAANLWKNTGRKKLEIVGTHRLTEETASVVKFFGLQYIEFQGKRKIKDKNGNNIKIKPILLVYTDNDLNNITPEVKENRILEKFSKIIKERKDKGYFQNIKEEDLVCKGVIWSATPQKNMSGTEKFEISKCRAKHYFYDYDVTQGKAKYKKWFKSEKDYLIYYNRTDKTYKSKFNSIVNMFLKILRFNDIRNVNNQFFNKQSLFKYLREEVNDEYIEFRTLLLDWSMNLNDTNINVISKKMDDYFFDNILTGVFGNSNLIKTIEQSEATSSFLVNKAETDNIPNTYSNNGVDITVGTVHSVKGETHTCTLYLESCMYSYESFSKVQEKPYIGEQLTGSIGSRTKEAMKMLYVGLSRPTHLLCYAIHNDRYQKLVLGNGNEEKLLKIWDKEVI